MPLAYEEKELLKKSIENFNKIIKGIKKASVEVKRERGEEIEEEEEE